MSDPKSKIIFLSLLKIFKVKRIRKPTLGNGAYLLLTCLKLWVSLPWLGLSLTCLLFRFCQGTWKQRIKSGLSFLLSHFTVLPLFSPCHSIFYPFSWKEKKKISNSSHSVAVATWPDLGAKNDLQYCCSRNIETCMVLGHQLTSG